MHTDLPNSATEPWRRMTFATAAERLAAMHRDVAADPDGDRFDAIVAAHAGFGDATLRFLAGVLAPGPDTLPADAVEPGIWEMMPALFLGLDAPQTSALLDEVLFTAERGAVYPMLASALRVAFPAEIVERAILRAARSSDDRARRNAHRVAGLVFGSQRDYRLSDAGRRALDASATAP